MKPFLTESRHVRLTKEAADACTLLRIKYPEEYKTTSDVIRAGIFALKRWKEDYEKKQIEEETKKC